MLACVESTWHLSISFPGCNIINKLNKLLLTALANLKLYLIDLFQVYSVLQSCRETTTYHCQPVISGPDAVCSISRAISRACCRVAQSDQKLMAACTHGWRGSRKAEWHLAVLPNTKTTSKGRNRFGFFQSILYSLGEAWKYSLLRIITLANLIFSYSFTWFLIATKLTYARVIQSCSELSLAKVISLTLHASGKHSRNQLRVFLQVCAC